MQDQINLFFELLELSSTGYTVSFRRDELSKIRTDINFDNCQIKNLLINYFGEGMFHLFHQKKKNRKCFFLRMFVLDKLLNPFAVKRMTI